MRLNTSSSPLLFLLPSIASISTAAASVIDTPAHATIAHSTEQNSTPTHTTIPSEYLPSFQTPTSTSTSSHFWDPLANVASHVLDEVEEHLHLDLRKRQGAAVTAIPTVATVVTQMNPTTVYYIGSQLGETVVQVSIQYIQTFAAVPDQWPTPSAGTVGLGTIQGDVGVVKTSKRDVVPQEPEPTGATIKIRGREVVKL